MLPGVYIAHKKDGTIYYRSSITFRNKHISLGSYTSENEANKAYLEASTLLQDTTILFDSTKTHFSNLSFEKQVTLYNFRDHNIYIKTPIYLKKNYFLYFIQQFDELKFDIDDLFYYATRKIMRRKGHLFVSDYGMQVNILSRFQIKNYAVSGKDYLFKNGDCTDFRYENIQVINQYYGVDKILTKQRVLYRSKIHIVGNHTLGFYKREETAAIAYNKAVDLLKKANITKNYQTNYLIGLSSKEYAEIYNKLSLSTKFSNYLSSLSSKNI